MTTPTTASVTQAAEQNRIARAIELEHAIQNPEPPEPTLPQEIASRAERGWDLHLRRRQLITHLQDDVFTVPADAPSGAGKASPSRTYSVRYGDQVESCTCTDFGVHGISCKHIVAVAVGFATRRRVYSTCQTCGVSSSEKALLGLRNDHDRHGPRYCLVHHPESLAGTLGDLGSVL
jgi:hypothetical protein